MGVQACNEAGDGRKAEGDTTQHTMNPSKLIFCAAALLSFLNIITRAQENAIPGAPAASANKNLFTNGNFEQGTDGWTLSAWNKKGQMSMDADVLHNGKPSLRVENIQGDDTQVTQKVAVKPNTRYRIVGYIRTKDVQTEKRGGKDGATLAVQGGFLKTPPVVKTKPWTRVTMEYVTGKESEITLGPRLGHNSAAVVGTAWFSELSLTEIGRNAKQ